MTSRIVVVGDALLDRDLVGSVTRVCPDAPVPVLDVEDEHARPGGAGLAAALLAADGDDVTLVTALPDDPAGRRLRLLLAGRGVSVLPLATEGTTREKIRVRAGSQSLVRVDRGTGCAPSGEVPEGLRDRLTTADAVLVSDYAGGVAASGAVRQIVGAAADRVPVVWDPHARGAEPVGGTTLVTPNQGEAASLASRDAADGRAEDGVPSTGDEGPLPAAARLADRLVRRWRSRGVVVTLGSRGALLSYGSGAPLVVPAPAAEGDPCGAGDRFAASVTSALARGELASGAVHSGVLAASAFVAAGGAAGFAARTPDQVPRDVPTGLPAVERVRSAGGTVVATGGCFDLLHAGHVAVLQAARRLGDALVVCLNSDASVRRLKGPDRPLVAEADRIRVLEALSCVDAVVVFDEDTPDAVLRRVRPHVWAKGGDYALHDLPEAAVLAEWGGQAVVLPYLEGRSTTGIIGAARGRG